MKEIKQSKYTIKNNDLSHIFNDTVLGVINDYSDVICKKVEQIYSAYSKEDRKLFFENMYFLPITECNLFKKIIDEILDDTLKDTKFILTTINYCINSQDYQSLKEELPFREIFKGKICIIQDDQKHLDNEIIEQTQNILKQNYIDQVNKLDEYGIYFKQICKENRKCK